MDAVHIPQPPSPMNHRPSPHSPSHSPVEVEDVTVEEYDGGPFLDYPRRKGWTTAEIEHPQSMGRSQKEIEQFFQTWLWFGLLFEFFKRATCLVDFVVHSEDGRCSLTTTHLTSWIANWTLRESKLSRSRQWTRAVHLNKVLWRVHRVFSVWGQASDPFPNSWMTVSLCILGETLDLAWKNCYLHLMTGKDRALADRGAGGTVWIHPSDMIRKRMLRDGWCPSAIRQLSGPQTTAGMYYASLLRAPGREVDHHRCSLNSCIAYQTAVEDYKTKHRDAHCVCQHVSVDITKVIEILDNGRIPVISYSEEQGITILEASSTVKYVALSHVWSDGLGNPKANSLPRCQLAHISNLVSQDKCNLQHFWLDTLCCPVAPKTAKNKAIILMRKTYQEADKVLVLDSYLQQERLLKMSNIEAFFSIRVCQWNRRLWTLEECVLGRKKLLFQFGGGILDHDAAVAEGILRFKLDMEKDASSVTESALAMGHALGIPSGVPLELFELGNSNKLVRHKLLDIQAELQNRQTTDFADEAVCLANLLSMDVQTILEMPKEKRMEAFWSSIKDVPSDIVFWMRSRLSTPGLRWAPASLLNGVGFLGGVGNDSHYGTRHGRGLLVFYPGWTLGCSPGSPIQVLFHFVDGSENCYIVTCFNQNFDGTASTIGKKLLDPWKMVNVFDVKAELALITKSDLRKSLQVEEFNAALVVITESKGNVNYVRKVGHASVKRAPKSWIGPKSMQTLQSFENHFRGRPLPEKFSAGDEEGGVNYTSLMSGKALEGPYTMWCVD